MNIISDYSIKFQGLLKIANEILIFYLLVSKQFLVSLVTMINFQAKFGW